MTPSANQRLVLVGGGHTHIQVLRRLMMKPISGVHTTLVVDTPIAVYSGMVPGFVAGQYSRRELEIDVRPLARRAGARLVIGRALGIDPRTQRIEVVGRPEVPFDIASFDIGSTVAGLSTPGVREYAFPTRPIASLVARVDQLVALSAARSRPEGEPFRVAVVGAGAGGIELAFTLHHRLSSRGTDAPIAIEVINAADEILPTYPRRLASMVRRFADRRHIEIRPNARVVAVDHTTVTLEGGDRVRADAVVWVTGATGQKLFAQSGLQVDQRDFLLVRKTLQSLEWDHIFAVGDCASMIDYPETPKAGVYAVRQGPSLIHNLEATLGGRRLRNYRPQRDFLTLLNLGDGTAIGSKWGLAAHGTALMNLKDHIDRKFMRRFRVLASDGQPAPTFPAMDTEMEMLCGGCASKIGQSPLERALQRLPAAADDPSVSLLADDAAVVELSSGGHLAATNDAFTAFTDDPYLVGRVAAVNALSDVVVTGFPPRYALAAVSIPEHLDRDDAEEELFQVMAGIRAELDRHQVTLLGGHSTVAAELSVGLTVLGLASDRESSLPIDALIPGQSLILTKALGTGVLLRADMQGRAPDRWMAPAIKSMLASNSHAARLAIESEVRAATDVTGFGLVGHLGEMARASGCRARIELSSVPILSGALELVATGLRSTFHEENAKARRGITNTSTQPDRFELLFDPQTSGGLLFAVDTKHAWSLLCRLRASGCPDAAIIGQTLAVADDTPSDGMIGSEPQPLIEVVDQQEDTDTDGSLGGLCEINDVFIPIEPGHAVGRGWTAATNHRPVGVTWHWTATRDLAECRDLLGGRNARRQGIASAHFAVGRSYREGVDRYVSLENRSWHAGKHQLLRWDGERLEGPELKASNTTIGIETVALGYSREGVEAEKDWIAVDTPTGNTRFVVQPWTDEQIELMIQVGRLVQRRWPHLTPIDHHGHSDLCSGYKSDPLGFPFARVLRGIYRDPEIPDVWSPLWTNRSRRQALETLGYDSLLSFQEANSMPLNNLWTTFVFWKIWAAFRDRELNFDSLSGA